MKIPKMVKQCRLAFILISTIGLAALAPKGSFADMPTQVIEVKQSTGTPADVTVQTRQPGRVQTPAAKVSLLTRLVRWIQEIFTGTIVIPS